MGKKRITRLLDQLKDQQQQDIQNAAGIFTVAQIAVNQLSEQTIEDAGESQLTSTIALPAAPVRIQKEELISKYGPYNACRKEAKRRGIKFRKTPKWTQIEAAFSYEAALRDLVEVYTQAHPDPDLQGMTIQIQL